MSAPRGATGGGKGRCHTVENNGERSPPSPARAHPLRDSADPAKLSAPLLDRDRIGPRDRNGLGTDSEWIRDRIASGSIERGTTPCRRRTSAGVTRPRNPDRRSTPTRRPRRPPRPPPSPPRTVAT